MEETHNKLICKGLYDMKTSTLSDRKEKQSQGI